MDGCFLYGCLDVRELPKTIVELLVPHNRLTGTVDLRFLPENLVEMNVRDNLFETVIADNRKIPKTLNQAMVGRCRPFHHLEREKTLTVHEVSGDRLDKRLYVVDYRRGHPESIRIR